MSNANPFLPDSAAGPATDPAGAAAPGAPDPRGCFDPTLAELPVRRVAVELVVDPLAVPHAPETIAAYRRAMLAGQRFPPIGVVALGGRFWVADGHKRWGAFRALGAVEVLVEVWTLRRWLSDQAGQVVRTGRRLARAFQLLILRPGEGIALLAAAPRHWWRVARSLAAHAGARGRRPAPPESSGPV